MINSLRRRSEQNLLEVKDGEADLLQYKGLRWYHYD